jgi:hypothetical protein
LSLPPGANQATGAPAGPPWPQLPGYKILKEIGRGGMSVVYLARQAGLNRLVALKMILAGVDADPEYRHRLRSEAEAVARLQHPNIVQIYEVGEHEGRPFLSFEYVEGGSLHDRIDKTPQAAKAAARLVETLAQAMHYAHQQGVIHRDLKPANVLLQQEQGRQGDRETRRQGPTDSSVSLSPCLPLSLSSFRPKITDFGVAKRVDAAGPTRTGAFVGTPSYMAPEQAGGGGQVGPATDVYALGAILYELLTGRPPFWAADPLDTLLQVRYQDPVSPRALQPGVPNDLETICMMCLQKEPAKRYLSAQALADDLHSFQAGEPIRARRAGTIERLLHWIRRHPLAAGSLAALLLAITTGFAGMAYGYVAARAAFMAEASKRHETQDALYFAYISLTERLWRGENAEEARLTLEKCLPAAGDIDRRGWEWFYLRRLCLEAQLRRGNAGERSVAGKRLPEHAGQERIDRLGFSADGRELLLISPFSQGILRLDAATGSLLGRWPVPLPRPRPDRRDVACLAEGGQLVAAASADDERVVELWAPATLDRSDAAARQLVALRGHDGPITSLALTADGRRLASAAWNAGQPKPAVEFKIWDVDMRRELIAWSAGDHGQVISMAFSPQARQLASCWQDGTIRIWDYHTSAEVGRYKLQNHRHGLAGVAFSPDGNRLASVDGSGQVRLWDAGAGRQILALPQLNGSGSSPSDFHAFVAFSPDGRRIVSNNADGSINVWDARDVVHE